MQFTLGASGKTVQNEVNCYLFCDHDLLGNTWYIKHPSTEYRYYANFIL